MTIANTIIQQLGGNRFIAMTGARNFLDTGTGLVFALPARLAKNKATRVRITLEPSDTYSVEFIKTRGLDVSTVSEHDMIYFDRLPELFSEETGLAVSL